MCDIGDAINSIGDLFSSPSVGAFQQAAPLLLPAAGAAIGGIAGGGTGALEGGLAGLAGGQLVGTGPNTIGSVFGVPQDQSLLGSVFNSSGAPIGGGGGYVPAGPSAAAVTAAGPTDPFGFGSGGLGSNVIGGGGTSYAGPSSIVTGAGYGGGQGAGGPSGGPSGGGAGAGGGGPNWLKYAPLALGLGGIGAELLRGTPKLPQQDALQAQANQLATQGSQLESALTTGKLPPGAQSIVDSSVAANMANVRSNFASMGLTGSTMEATALEQARQQGAELTFKIADQMAQLGLKETATSADILQALMRDQLEQDKEMQSAIVGFAQAAAGGFRPIATG